MIFRIPHQSTLVKPRLAGSSPAPPRTQTAPRAPAVVPPWFTPPETWGQAVSGAVAGILAESVQAGGSAARLGGLSPSAPASGAAASSTGPGAPAALGNIGKCASPPTAAPDFNFRNRRQKKYELRRILRKLTFKWFGQAKKLLENGKKTPPEIEELFKVSKIQTKDCGVKPIPKKNRLGSADNFIGDGHVGISLSDGRAAWRMVRFCKNSRYCAFCADKKMAREQKKINKLLDLCKKNNWTPFMLTLTRPHVKKNILTHLLKDFSEARKRLFSGKNWEKWRINNNYIGIVRSEEIPHGQNGWHPHQHILMILERPPAEIDKNEITKYFKNRWHATGLAQKWFTKNSLQEIWFEKHGADIKFGNIDTGYLTKSLSYELSSEETKKSKTDSISIWEILRRSVTDQYHDKLLREYIEAVKGRPPIRWSAKLQLLVDFDEENEGESELIFTMPAYQFQRLGRHGLELQILEAIEDNDVQLIEFYKENYGLTPVTKNN